MIHWADRLVYWLRPGGDSDPWHVLVDNDKIFEQALTTLDGAGNATLIATLQRNNGDTSTGVLGPSNARVSYAAFWQDGAGRQIAAGNYGTNGGTAPTQPLSAPASSDSVLVSLTGYNARGEAFETIDPAGTVNRTLADDAGRQVCMIGNFVAEALGAAGEGLGCAPGVPLASEVTGYGPVSRPCHDPCANPTAGPDVNVTTLTSYTPDGNIATLTAKNPVTGDQVTRYLYGTTLGTGGLGDSAIARSDLLVAILYPDAADSGDSIRFAYNRQSQVNWMQDQNGNVHEYDFDGLARRLADIVSLLGAGVNGAVRRIDTAYDIRGMIESHNQPRRHGRRFHDGESGAAAVQQLRTIAEGIPTTRRPGKYAGVAVTSNMATRTVRPIRFGQHRSHLRSATFMRRSSTIRGTTTRSIDRPPCSFLARVNKPATIISAWRAWRG